MTGDASLFSRLTLNKWFKYLLYLGGILLIVSLFSTSSVIPSLQRFALYSIIMATIMWVFSEILLLVSIFADKDDEEAVQTLVILYSLASFFVLLIWVIAVALPFASTIT